MFAVIYRFKVKESNKTQFIESWEAMTHEFRDTHGGLGSCLHNADDGLFYAYARWPSRELWEKEKEIVNTAAMAAMKDSVEQGFPPIALEVEKDLLVK